MARTFHAQATGKREPIYDTKWGEQYLATDVLEKLQCIAGVFLSSVCLIAPATSLPSSATRRKCSAHAFNPRWALVTRRFSIAAA